MYLKTIVGSVLLAVASLASAGIPLFEKTAGENWPAFEADLVKEGVLKDGSFSTDILAAAAYARAKNEKLPVAEMSWEQFKVAFLKENNFGSAISVSDFRKLGQTKQILMPDMPATATVPVATPVIPTGVIAPPVAAVAAPQVEQSKADSLAAFAIASQFASLEKQVTALKAEAAKAASTEAQASATKARVDELQAKLAALTAAQANLAKKGEEGGALKTILDEQSKRIEEVLAGITASNEKAVAVLKGDVDGLKAQVTTLKADVAEVKASAIPQWMYYLAGAVAVLFAAILWLFRANGKRKDEVLAVTKAVADHTQTTEANFATVRKDVTELKRSVAEVKEAIGLRKVIFPDDFAQKILQVGPNHPEYVFDVCTEDAKDVLVPLRIVYLRAGKVMIYGLDDQGTPANLEVNNLERIIGRAAKVDHKGNSRLKGIDLTTTTTPSAKVVPIVSAAMA